MPFSNLLRVRVEMLLMPAFLWSISGGGGSANAGVLDLGPVDQEYGVTDNADAAGDIHFRQSQCLDVGCKFIWRLERCRQLDQWDTGMGTLTLKSQAGLSRVIVESGLQFCRSGLSPSFARLTG